MKLYHASTLVVEHPDVVHSRPNLDFGYGFYLTALYDQAVLYAERFTRRGKPAYVSEYDSDTYKLVSEGVADMHCRSDEYLADELLLELQEKK